MINNKDNKKKAKLFTLLFIITIFVLVGIVRLISSENWKNNTSKLQSSSFINSNEPPISKTVPSNKSSAVPSNTQSSPSYRNSSTSNLPNNSNSYSGGTTNTPIASSFKSWGCNESLYTGFTGAYSINSINIDTYCNSESGTNELDCSGNINTMLTSQSYPYAQLNMDCSTQQSSSSYSWTCTQSLYTGFTGPDTINSISLDPLCTSSALDSSSLDCNGTINTDLTSQSYPYAQLNMDCSD